MYDENELLVDELGPVPLELNELKKPIIKFFKKHSCYDIMPASTKVIVFDIDAQVKEAFSVAVENNIQFATLYDSKLSKLCGILTVTDLIDVLIHYHNETNVIKDLVNVHTIRKWRTIGTRKRPLELISSSPEENLWTVMNSLEKNRIRRIPVLAEGSLLHVVTHAKILAYLVKNVDFDLAIFKKTLVELGIGTFKEPVIATPDEKLFDVIKKFAKHQISAVPIVNSSGVVINVYSRTDVMFITKSFDLDQTVEEALKSRPKIPVYTCIKNETLENVLKDLSKSRIHRLVIVDEKERVIGVVSVSDILKFFLHD